MVWKTGSSPASYTHPAQHTRQQSLNSCQSQTTSQPLRACTLGFDSHSSIGWRSAASWGICLWECDKRNAAVRGNVERQGSCIGLLTGREKKTSIWSLCEETARKHVLYMYTCRKNETVHLSLRCTLKTPQTCHHWKLETCISLSAILRNQSCCFGGYWLLFLLTLVICHNSE